MLRASALLRQQEPGLRFVIVAADKNLLPEVELAARSADLAEAMGWVVIGESQAWMQRVEAAAVASGTATLEAACLGLPFVLVYRVHPLTYAVARLVLKLRWIGMANILVGREVVRELLQGQLTAQSLADEITALRKDAERRTRCQQGMLEAVHKLGDGHAYERAAEAVLNCIGG
jgi:lipid-A-disaccharide synthase